MEPRRQTVCGDHVAAARGSFGTFRSLVMRHAWIVLLLLSFAGVARSAEGADYTIDFGLVPDLEELRPLVDLCTDFGELEQHRAVLESTSDLESLRNLLERIGIARFRGCPRIAQSDGVTRIGTKAKPRRSPDRR